MCQCASHTYDMVAGTGGRVDVREAVLAAARAAELKQGNTII